MIAAGGTGGHLYPALTVADTLRARHPERAIEFVGGRRGLELRLVPQAGYALWSLPVRGIKGRGPAARVAAATGAAYAVARCLGRFARRRPALVIGAGGYASGPAVLAATLWRVPTMVLEQNHFPGATNRWLGPKVDAVCLPSEDAARRLRGHRFVTGNPVRGEFAAIDEPEEGTRGLRLLVFGGSRGARSINRALLAALDTLARLDPPPRIVHQTGEADLPEARAAAARYPAGCYEAHAFLDDMPARLAAASLVVCRAGATTVAELAAAGRAAVLIPFPHATDDHQTHNARALADAGAAVLVRDEELSSGRLTATITELAADPQRRREMGRAARAVARPDAAERIADIADALLERRPIELVPFEEPAAGEGGRLVP